MANPLQGSEASKPPPPPPDLIHLDEVARLCNVSVDTVRYWRYTGSTGIRFTKIGKRVKARRAEVLAWRDGKFCDEQ